jgi:putative endonuclease
MNIGKTGAEGEKRVANFLREKGFSVIKRNYVCRYGEIDIIAENDKLLLFVEVKTRKENALVSGAFAVDSFKQKRLILTANDYIVKTENDKQPRFDVAEVLVYVKPDGKTGYKLNYIENAF